MKRQVNPPFYFLGILIILMFYSCVNEEIQHNTETSIVSKLKNELKLEEFTNQNLTVNWDNIHTTQKDNFEIFEVETNEINPTKIKSNLFQSDLKHELIAVKKGDELFSYVIKVYSSLNYALFPGSIQNLGDFTGTLMVFDLNGKKLDELVIFNGTSKNVSRNSAITPLHEAINLFASNKNLTSKTNDCFLTLTTNLTSTLYTDHYYKVTVGSYTTLDYSHTTSVTVNSSSTTVVPSPCGNKGQNNFLDEYFTKRSTYIDEIILDPTFENNPCLLGVYSKLGGAPTFQSYLQKFDGKFSFADLKLSVGISAKYPEATAATFQPVNKLIEIRFNPTKLGTPQLNIARTFIHELIHAEIYRELLSVAGTPNIPWSADFINSVKDDFPVLADYYTRFVYNVPAGQQPSSAQHELMADHYRDIIIQAMKEFDPTQSDETYTALSWIGLMGSGKIDDATGLPPLPTVAWKNIPQAQRVQLLNIFYNFRDTNTPCQK